jgi:hypothetical protein
MALAHTVAGTVGAACRRGDLFREAAAACQDVGKVLDRCCLKVGVSKALSLRGTLQAMRQPVHPISGPAPSTRSGSGDRETAYPIIASGSF